MSASAPWSGSGERRREHAEPRAGFGREALDDACRRVVACALRAPSPQNRQPWRVRLTGSGFALYLDGSLVAAQTDPVARQAHIALGAFLESCVIASPTFGYSSSVELFPEGDDPLGDLGRSPVAVVGLEPGPRRPDPLAALVARRHTNRRTYQGPVTSVELETLLEGRNARSLVVVRDGDVLRHLRAALLEAMRIDTAGDATHGEKVAMIRASDEEAAKTGDGFTYPNLGYTGRMRALVERLYPLRGARSHWFRHGTMFVARRVLRSAPAIAMVTSPGNARADQIEAGRALLRVWLTATGLGLAMHPMCQVLQERPEQAGPQASLRGVLDQIAPGTRLPTAAMTAGVPTVQMVFRLGRARPTPPSPVRPLGEVLAP